MKNHPGLFWNLVLPAIPTAYGLYMLCSRWGWWRTGQRSTYESFQEALWPPIVMALLIGAVLFMGAFGGAYGLSVWIGNHARCVWEECWHAPLASLRNVDSISGTLTGSVFLLSGRVGASEVYQFYEDAGGFQAELEARREVEDRIAQQAFDDGGFVCRICGSRGDEPCDEQRHDPGI